jgi:trk system potassium uptake protein TrkA
VRAIVAGAGRLGQEVAVALAEGGHDVALVDLDDTLVVSLRDRVRGRVIYGDACEPVVLEEAGALKADVLLACAGEDQVNLVISFLAKRHFDVPKVVARINEPENGWLFTDEWGVDVAVSASSTLLALVQEATSVVDTVGLMRLGDAGVQVIETTLTERSVAAGQTLAQLVLPAGCIVGAVLREGRPAVPGGSFVLAAGDEVVVISDSVTEGDVRRIFQG